MRAEAVDSTHTAFFHWYDYEYGMNDKSNIPLQHWYHCLCCCLFDSVVLMMMAKRRMKKWKEKKKMAENQKPMYVDQS